MVSSFFFQLFPKQNSQLSLRQFLFDINRISVLEELVIMLVKLTVHIFLRNHIFQQSHLFQILVCDTVLCGGKWKKIWCNPSAPQGHKSPADFWYHCHVYVKKQVQFFDNSMFMELWNYFYTLSRMFLVGEWFYVVENHGCVIVYLLCERSVEHPTSFVEASQKGEARGAEQ